MNTEPTITKPLGKINETSKWKGENGDYRLFFCGCCDSWNIACDDCSATSCNGTSCPKCHEDIETFSNLKTGAVDFLSDQETRVFNKIDMLKKHIETCLKNSVQPIDWKWLHDKGELCWFDYSLFEVELYEIGLSKNTKKS